MGRFFKPIFLEKENICQRIMADIQGDKPTENRDMDLRFPPIIALEKAKEPMAPPKIFAFFKSTNGRTN